MSHFAGDSWIQESLAIEIIYQIKKESCCVKKKLSLIDIDKLKAISSKNRFHEKRPIRCTVIVIAFFFLLVALAFSRSLQINLRINLDGTQMTFLGIWGASAISIVMSCAKKLVNCIVIAITSLSYVSVSELDQSALDQNLFYCFMDRQSRIVFIVFVAAMAYQTFSVVFIHFHNFFCSLNRCTHII